MTKRLAIIDRTLVAIIGIIALLMGVWTLLLYFGQPHAVESSRYLDGRQIPLFMETTWYSVVLWVVVLVGIIGGFLLVLANINQRHFNKQRSELSNAEGAIDIAVAKFAAACAEQLADEPEITSARSKVAWDRDRRIVQWTITAEPNADLTVLQALTAAAAADFQDVIAEMDIDTRFLIHLSAT
ncbi:hypothetical protein [Corynebacterium caspium]|uniref:hypothetical protein n=1 Tax=Corynebacterium caspium TaxID=234828 RepID=UPI00037B7C95|nr:hypothetical protein [Corynebacterium caspium]WKD59853.1 hypothetical protein CCASP_07370 [Corynebacterium caspium DSM 44850]